MVKRKLIDHPSFVTVAQEDSFTRAAALLGVTRKTVKTQAINDGRSRSVEDPEC